MAQQFYTWCDAMILEFDKRNQVGTNRMKKKKTKLVLIENVIFVSNDICVLFGYS
jgi:hypothetical protein